MVNPDNLFIMKRIKQVSIQSDIYGSEFFVS